ncbi:DUF3732 domain-containing protein [Paenibacillus thiaminolyticus]|uniref:DUF3732 domain-containing protein n=1 Tax=Paenibacillus thiaminolyticus TaxID=49283 RepID=UPI003D2AC02B
MYFKIKHIILWPRDTTKARRVITFHLHKINVITGDSQKGKSSIIPIIDYCLGSSKCTIPVGIIRQKAEWFGVVIQLNNELKLFARKEPGVYSQSSEVFIHEGFKEIDDLPWPESLTNVEQLKNRLNELSNMPHLTLVDEDDDKSSGKRASFRDFSAFQFQPQHIVANPYTLFFKADTAEHQERLRNIFPLVLGAIDKKTLFLKQQLKMLEKELQRKERNLLEANKISDNWIIQLRDYYSKAREYGLLKSAPEPESTWKPSLYISYLRSIFSDSTFNNVFIEEKATERAVIELQKIVSEESDISREIGIQRYQLSKFLNLYNSEKEYSEAINVQKERLEPASWLANLVDPNQTCIFCGSTSDLAFEEIQKLNDYMMKLSSSSQYIDKSYDILDREIIKRKNRLKELENSLNTVRRQRQLLEIESEKIREIRQTENEIFKFVGRLEKALEDYALVHENHDLLAEINALKSKVQELKIMVDPERIKNNIKYRVDKVSKGIVRYAKFLGVENPENPVILDINNLTLRKQTGKRDDFLWEIGSGANWMGYHIATLLALHDHFTELNWNPVPQFLIFDQPSQVYFPDKLQTLSDINYTPEDILKVQKIFTAFVSHLNLRKENPTQIILIEHADEITWASYKEYVHLVKRWRNDDGSEDNALIPQDWLV